MQNYRDAFAEVNVILRYFDKDLMKKIPKKLIEKIRKNMSTSYMFIYDNSKGLNEQNLKQETRAILSVIYRNYICNKDIKEEIIQKNRIELNDIEKNKEYGDLFFLKRTVQTQNIDENKNLIVIEEQNVITKIIEKIKLIWRKIHG